MGGLKQGQRGEQSEERGAGISDRLSAVQTKGRAGPETGAKDKSGWGLAATQGS